MAELAALKDLVVQLQDGSQLHLERDDDDRLVTTGFTVAAPKTARAAAGSKQAPALAVPNGLWVVGFGPWPTWSTNTGNRTDTRPDDESGLFEPERLFVLREQYVFLASTASDPNPTSLGPIHKAWWLGTEGVVQARAQSGRAPVGKPSLETNPAQGELPKG